MSEKYRKYGKKMREKRKAAGMCVRCGKAKAVEGQTLCVACRVRNGIKANEYYHNLTEEQKQKLLDKKKKERAERKAQGLCIKCGQPVFGSYVLCKKHYYERVK